MSVPFGSNVLTLSAVAKQLRTTFETFTDRRRAKNTHTLGEGTLAREDAQPVDIARSQSPCCPCSTWNEKMHV